ISYRDRRTNPSRPDPRFRHAASHCGSAFARCNDGLSIPSVNYCEEVKLVTETGKSDDSPGKIEHPTHRVRLPGFIKDEEIGLGDVIKRATSYFGIKHCGGCEKRATALNRWMVFTR